jgi:hypothetical protein
MSITIISRLEITIYAFSLSSMFVLFTELNLMKSVATNDAKIPTDVTIKGKKTASGVSRSSND